MRAVPVPANLGAVGEAFPAGERGAEVPLFTFRSSAMATVGPGRAAAHPARAGPMTRREAAGFQLLWRSGSSGSGRTLGRLGATLVRPWRSGR
jgi:hypothetical protein